MTQKIKKTIFTACILLLSSLAFTPIKAGAACNPRVDPGNPQCPPASSSPTTDPNCNDPNPTPATLNACVKNNGIIHDLNAIVNILGAIVGVVVTGAIILGGIQYSMAGDSPDGVTKAKKRITNGLIALAAFLLVYGFLQWIVPGGVFNNS